MTVSELLARMSSFELAEWMAYYEIEPFGEERADFRAGTIAATVANVHRGKSGRNFRPRDFMAYLDRPTHDPDALSRALRAAFEQVS